MQPQPPPQAGAIGIELRSEFLGVDIASTSFLRKYNPFVEIDGYKQEREGGAWHVFTVAPGWHLVRVYFKVRPTVISQETGARSLQVQVYPGAMARLRYTSVAFWPMRGGVFEQVG